MLGGSVLVTGATGALGTAVCGVLLEARIRVHATYLADGDAVRFDAVRGDRCDWYALHRVDLTDEAQVARLFERIEQAEPLAALVHVTGGFAAAPIEETSLAMFEQQVAVNARTLFLCAREAVRRMRPRGAGRIVAVGARAVDVPGPNVAAYTASKGAVHGMVRAIAEELRGSGISAFGVVPGIIDTPANRAAMPDADRSRWVAPEGIAQVVHALVSGELRVATGALVPVHG
jgi:NAD(P)-dependent dehydrogenase (short-subunit alcohol dehydrogenase family)